MIDPKTNIIMTMIKEMISTKVYKQDNRRTRTQFRLSLILKQVLMPRIMDITPLDADQIPPRADARIREVPAVLEKISSVICRITGKIASGRRNSIRSSKNSSERGVYLITVAIKIKNGKIDKIIKKAEDAE